jgi:hypothetical protein
VRVAVILLPIAAIAVGALLRSHVAGRPDAVVPEDAAAEAVPAPGTPPPVAGLRSRGALAREDLAPTRDPTPLAAEFLLACQGEDGFFHAERGTREGDPAADPRHDAALTGLAILVLLDVADPTGDARAARAARAALDALAKRPDGRLAEDGDLEGHALLTWALAAGYAHTDEARYRPKVLPAVERLVRAAHAEGGWRAPGGTADDHLLLTMGATGALHEALTLTQTVSDPEPAVDAIEAAGEWAARFEPRDVARFSPGARCAWALLLRAIERYEDPIRPEEALRPLPPPGTADAFSSDHAAILWGTVHRFLGGDVAAWRTWETGAVFPALARQRLDDPGRGSWDPADGLSRRRGRAWSTAVEAMAWLVIRVEYKPPKGT